MNLQDIKREYISIKLQIEEKWAAFQQKNPKAVVYLKRGFFVGKWLTILGFGALLVLFLAVRFGFYRHVPTYNEIKKIVFSLFLILLTFYAHTNINN